MLILITSGTNGYNYTIIEVKSYTAIKIECGLTCQELIKAIAQVCNMAEIHDNSRAIYNQALQTRVNQQFNQAYT